MGCPTIDLFATMPAALNSVPERDWGTDSWEMHSTSKWMHHLYLPSLSPPILSTLQDTGGPSSCPTYSSNMAMTGLAYLHDGMPTDLSPFNAAAPYTGCILHPNPQMLHLKSGSYMVLGFGNNLFECSQTDTFE